MKAFNSTLLGKIFLIPLMGCLMGYFLTDQTLEARGYKDVKYVTLKGKVTEGLIKVQVDTFIKEVPIIKWRDRPIEADTFFANELDSLRIKFKDNTFTFLTKTNDTLFASGIHKSHLNKSDSTLDWYIPFSNNKIMVVKRHYSPPHTHMTNGQID